MNKKQAKVKLTDKDRKTISGNLKICTDSHGASCENQKVPDKNRMLN